jgi:alkanesulfonate monooxygenase SsuD/methylene tetrahydromethanopterin reductase-like flavin-dependent oxidoreductase (luciferase family)
MDRFWEAHDFIIKAMTHRGENFNWEGEYFHYRQVNIWPRPVQQPHPPVWSTTNSRNNAMILGEKGYVMATLGSGYGTRPLYDAYRQAYLKKWRKPAPADRVAYLGLVAVADNEAEAHRRGELVAGYLRTSGIVHIPFRNPPGYLSVEDNAKILRGLTAPRGKAKDGRPVDIFKCSVQDLIDSGVMFCGTPDQVYRQIVDFCEYCGGMGNLLMMGQAGFLGHEDTVSNLTMFAKEVMPRLKAYKQPEPETVAA